MPILISFAIQTQHSHKKLADCNTDLQPRLATIAQVAVAAPLPKVFDYLPPVAPSTALAPGLRVVVPFGRGQRVGIIVALSNSSDHPHERLKSIVECLDPEPLFRQAELDFIRWSADYYRCPFGEALFAALPTRLRQPKPCTQLSPPAPSAPPRLLAPLPQLNPEQQHAVTAVAAHQGFGCFLLDGVTGSGKTEVYLRQIVTTLAAGGQVLVLVPEIGLTPQLFERLQARLEVPMAVLHSGLNERERERGWRLAASGAIRVLLGTRSAIFAPLPELALVIVDEEHDLSLKQQDGFRYSARDLAVRRAQLARCPVLLGSATPSLESLRNAQLGRYQHLVLSQRAGSAQPPKMVVVDIRAQPLLNGLSHALLTRIEQELTLGNQVLLFLNRRGFAPVLTCHACGWISVCPHCDARLTIHRQHQRLLCHHCALIRPLPVQCPECSSPDLRPLGQGTERIEDRLQQRFPGIPIARIDRDSTRRKGELARLLAAAQRGDYPILLGTQMLAKGHHLPGITLVGILDLDHGLYGADFRATERMAQLLMQVAGRAGRAERPGTVMLQTRHPRHPLLHLLLRQGYRAFAQAALAERQAAQLPPFTHQVLLRADSTEEQAAMDFLQQVRTLIEPLLPGGVMLLGPAPAAMVRRAGRSRAQLLLQGAHRGQMQQGLDCWLPALRALRHPRHLRWSVDIDPQETV